MSMKGGYGLAEAVRIGHLRIHIFSIASLFLFSIILYFNATRGQFLWDDIPFIAENEAIRSVKNIGLFFRSPDSVASVESWGPIYRPLRTLSYAIDYMVWGLDPYGFHLSNLFLNSAISVAVYLLVAALSSQVFVAAAAAFLFAAHPVHTEAIAWLSGRAEALFSLFFIISLLLYIESLKRKGARKLLLLLSCASFSAALFAKETAAVLPVILILLSLTFKPAFPTADKSYIARSGALYLIVLAAYFVARGYILGSPRHYSYFGGSFYWTILTMLKVFAIYLRLLLFPVNLNADYLSLPLSKTFFSLPSLSSAAFISIYLIMLAILWHKSRGLFFWVAWIAIILFPVSNIAVPLNYLMAERWLYLPSVGFCAAVAHLARPGSFRRSVPSPLKSPCFILGAVIIVIIFYSALTVRRNAYWRDGLSLWTDVVKKFPDNPNALTALATISAERGSKDKAALGYKLALYSSPGFAEALVGLGNVNRALGRSEAAEELYKMALLSHQPALSLGNINLGVVHQDRGYYDRAIFSYKASLLYGGPGGRARLNIANLYAKMGLKALAASEYGKALELDPSDPVLNTNMGALYLDSGSIDKAFHSSQMARSPGDGPLQAASNSAIALNRKGYRDRAALVYASLIAIEPRDVASRRALAYLAAERGYPGVTLKLIAGKQGAEGISSAADLGLASALSSAGFFDKAAGVLKSFLAFDPQSGDAHYLLGNVLYRKGIANLALKEYQGALLLNPSMADAAYNTGAIFYELKLRDKAYLQFMGALATDPDHARAFVYMGNMLKRRGLIYRSLIAYKLALNSDPFSADGHKNIAILYLEDFKSYSMAKSHLKKSLKIEPGQAEAEKIRKLVEALGG